MLSPLWQSSLQGIIRTFFCCSLSLTLLPESYLSLQDLTWHLPASPCEIVPCHSVICLRNFHLTLRRLPEAQLRGHLLISIRLSPLQALLTHTHIQPNHRASWYTPSGLVIFLVISFLLLFLTPSSLSLRPEPWCDLRWHLAPSSACWFLYQSDMSSKTSPISLPGFFTRQFSPDMGRH